MDHRRVWCAPLRRNCKAIEAYSAASTAFESLLIFISVILLYTRSIHLTNTTNLVFIALLGWTFGAQSVITKTLGVPTIPAQVVTGAMADLLSDARLFAPLRSNIPRNQRAAFIIIFFASSCIGGTILVKVNAELVLLLVAIIKLVVSMLFLVVPGVPRKLEADAERERVPSEKPAGELFPVVPI